MRRDEILEYANLLQIGPQARGYSRAGWVNFRCPLAPWKHAKGRDSTPSFGIKIDDGHSHVWCFTCKTSGTFASLVYELGRFRKVDYSEIAREIERIEIVGPSLQLRSWDEFVEADQFSTEGTHVVAQENAWPDRSEEHNFYTAAGHHYLAGRGISPTTAIGLGLRYDPWQRRILFPVYTDRGRFAGFSGRRTEPAFGVNGDGEPIEPDGRIYIKARDYCGLRKRELLLGGHFLGDAARDTDHAKYIYRGSHAAGKRQSNILLEGLFDYAWGQELGYRSSVALLGTALTPEKRAILVQSGRPLILFLDNDMAGAQAQQAIIEDLWGVVPLLEVRYPNGFEDTDPASLPAAVFHDMIRSARLVTSIKPETFA